MNRPDPRQMSITLGMGALNLEHLGPEHDTCVRCTGRRRSRRRVSGPRTGVEDLASFRLNAIRAGVYGPPDDGSIGRRRDGRVTGFTPTSLSQLIGRLQEFAPSSRLIPRPRAGWVAVLKNAQCVSPLQLAYLLIQTGPSATRYAPPCATPSSGATSTLAVEFTSPGSGTGQASVGRSAACTTAEPPLVAAYPTSVPGAAALRLASPVPGALPFLPSSVCNMFVFSAFALL